MTCIMGDVASDGPIPGDHSTVCFGAIVVEPSLGRTFLRAAEADLGSVASRGPSK
jgi:hypothetical protein